MGEDNWLPPVPDPEKIVCIGLNYRTHAAEAGIDPPDAPDDLRQVPQRAGRPGRNGRAARAPAARSTTRPRSPSSSAAAPATVDAAEALDHVAGYMLFNDLSARDLQFATPQWMPGKVFDGSAPCGPALVTARRGGPARRDRDRARPERRGRCSRASTADLIFSIPELVAHLSTLMTLEPGDIVATGTPAGVGSVREPRVWLAPGDEIVITSPTLGRLETRIADPA